MTDMILDDNPNLTRLAWLREHINHVGEGCLIWPFGRDDKGYGILSVGKGKVRKAHRVMCAIVHGDPPTPEHHAAHSCGNGHLGCIHPRHLSWKTPEENQQDTILHGRVRQKGTPRQKLTEEQVAQIRALRGEKNRAEVAAMFGVRTETIDRIWAGKARTGLPRRPNTPIAPGLRPAMVARAKEMRAAGNTYQHIGDTLGVARLTARTMSRE